MQPTSDGGYIVGGYSESNRSGDKSQANKGQVSTYDYWIVKLKADGTKSWDKTIGGSHFELLTALQQTQDGGYILGGYSTSEKSGDKSEDNKGKEFSTDYWIVKLNADGSKAWDKTFGGNKEDNLTSLQQTQDGGFILSGTSTSDKSGDKTQAGKGIWIVKLQANGTKVWDRTIIGGGENKIQQTPDGGYLLGSTSGYGIFGEKTDVGKGETDYWIVKLKADGTKDWDKAYGGTSYEQFQDIRPTSDGGYLLGGSSYSDKGGDKSEASRNGKNYQDWLIYDYWVIKIKADGSKEWDRTLGGSADDRLKVLIETKEGTYLLGGTSGSPISGDKTETSSDYNVDYWVVKLKANGSKIWDKTLGGEQEDELTALQQVADGNFILGGTSFSGASKDKSEPNRGECESNCSTDYWLVKIDNSGANLKQYIVFNPIPYKILGDMPFTLSATASSGLPVSFKVVSGPATLKGNILTLTGVGTVTIKATQAGSATYLSAEATQTFLVQPVSLIRKGWDKTYGGSAEDVLTTMVATTDGGYLVGGTSNSGKSGDRSQAGAGKDYWIIKVDRSGKKQWDKSYGGNYQDKLATIITTPDGGYLLGGTSESTISGDKTEAVRGGADYWLVKIDSTGKKEWDKTLGGNNEDILNAVLPTPDGGYLVGGTSNSTHSGDKSQASKGLQDYWVVKITGTGRKLWDKTFGGGAAENLASLAICSNGDYLLGGSSGSGYSGDKEQSKRGIIDYWLVRITASGTKIWDKAYGGIKSSYRDPGTDPTDTTNAYVNYYGTSTLSAIVATTDGGFLLGGTSNAATGREKSEDNLGKNYTARNKYWVVKIDDKGNKVWDKTYAGGLFESTNGIGANTYTVYSGDSDLKAIVSTPDNGFLLAGNSTSTIGKDKTEALRGDFNDYWAVKIDAQGRKQWDKSLGGLRYDFLAAAVNGSAGGFVLGGASDSDMGGDKSEFNRTEKGVKQYDYWLVQILDENTPLANWNMRYGGSGNDLFTSVIKTSDGGYLSGGYTNSGVSGDKTQANRGENDYWIVKSDKNGKKLWDKRFGGSGNDYLNLVIQTQDKGYLLAGSSFSGIGGDKSQDSRGDRDYWIVKTDAKGNKQWDKRFGGTGADELKQVLQTAKGEYLLAGTSNSPVGGDKSQNSQGGQDFWVLKVNSEGELLWDKRFGGFQDDILEGLAPTVSDGFLLGGRSASGRSGDKTQSSRGGNDYWLVRITSTGQKVWDKRFGGSGTDDLMVVSRSGANSGDFIIAGHSTSGLGGDKSQDSRGGKDFWLLKINGDGQKLFDKRFGGSQDEGLRSILRTSDGGYLLAGRSESDVSGDQSEPSQGGNDYWLVKTSSTGMLQWDKRVGGSGEDELRTAIQTSDGGYLLGGRSSSGVSGDRTQPSQGGTDYWLVKIASPATSQVVAREVTLLPKPAAEIKEVQVEAFPNPSSDKLTMRFRIPETQTATLKVYDLQGRAIAVLFEDEAQANQLYQVEWEAQKQAPGMYLLQLQTTTNRSQSKVLLVR
ncbi:T9SS type A sorting domain-containing protein [Adhaeribacter swui]|uniref:T9SS type A sorting domain-containing protein n=1 Tax=Adhaeribacter swui TaxID=2086471 RepID=A0A7G7G3C0_9BACT|nr:T9SS type A sorting domain-containing protein [Adhaeribacter swui]QNF31654.1 T9SS type A sorting domain-containing protein [Adhaeribacter swui]